MLHVDHFRFHSWGHFPKLVTTLHALHCDKGNDVWRPVLAINTVSYALSVLLQLYQAMTCWLLPINRNHLEWTLKLLATTEESPPARPGHFQCHQQRVTLPVSKVDSGQKLPADKGQTPSLPRSKPKQQKKKESCINTKEHNKKCFQSFQRSSHWQKNPHNWGPNNKEH